eukprot:TRINITY_DN17749_c1_g1_i1.p1 TRINITY_DN17749_c1_g1~~TRINITY_DN17749_c1_g1_i1.p1  ORF type:complete len:319 (+),score=62.92 TRINITY_DN17749_c1_g1_i1:76-1032(+)
MLPAPAASANPLVAAERSPAAVPQLQLQQGRDADEGPAAAAAEEQRRLLLQSPRLIVADGARAAYASAQRTAQSIAGTAEGYYRQPPPPVSKLVRFLLAYRLAFVFLLLGAALRPWRWSAGPSSDLTAESLGWHGAKAARVSSLDAFLRVQWVLLRSAATGRFLSPDGQTSDSMPRGRAALRRAAWRVDIVERVDPPRSGRRKVPPGPSCVVRLSSLRSEGARGPLLGLAATAAGRLEAGAPAGLWLLSFPRALGGHACLMVHGDPQSPTIVSVGGGEGPGFALRTSHPLLLSKPSGPASFVVLRIDFPATSHPTAPR